LEVVGQKLFEALFQGRICRLYDRNVGSVMHLPEQGLRIRLRIDITIPALVQIARLPWELLYDPMRNEYMSRNLQTPIVRELVTGHPPGPEHIQRPLRILLASANPINSVRLNLDSEIKKIRRACSKCPDVSFVSLKNATLSRLLKTIKDKGPFQVLHFMGHGLPPGKAGEGGLMLEDDNRRSHVIGSRAFADMISNDNKPSLIVLNACNSSGFSLTSDLQPITGVATALIQKGFTTVVGMWTVISDKSAISFSQAFYQKLADGETVEAAMFAARLKILQAGDSQTDWTVPILYRHVELKQVFQPPQIEEPPPPPRPSWRRVALIIFSVLAVIACMLVPLWDQRQAKLTIDFPPVGAQVDWDQEVRGAAKIKAYYYLFVVDPNEACWLQQPSPVSVSQDGTWSATARLPGRTGDHFKIVALAMARPLGESWKPGIPTACGLLPSKGVVRAERSVEIKHAGKTD
jgi:hypothetical protein